MTGMVCSFHVSSVDHFLSGVYLLLGAVVCTCLSHRRSAVLPFSAENYVMKPMESVGYVWLRKIKRYSR